MEAKTMQKQSPMYTIGMIFRAIWPAGDAPAHIIDTVLTRPATGLGLARQHATKWGGIESLAELMDRLPADLADPSGGITIEDQGPFWLGYYHYLDSVRLKLHFGSITKPILV